MSTRGSGFSKVAVRSSETVSTDWLSVAMFMVHAAIVGYVGVVTSLIEGRQVSEEEIVEMLVRAMRQHSIARRRRIDYVLAYLKTNGP